MRHIYLLTTLVLGLSTAAHAIQPRTEIIERFDDLRMVAFVPTADIVSSPEWNADTSEPPFSVAQAIRAVREFEGGHLEPVREIELRPIPESPTRWHYLVKTSNSAKTTRFDIYVVLMNGEVIPAMIEPESVR